MKQPGGPGWKRQEWDDFGYVAGPGPAPPLAAGTSYTRRESARAPVKEDVFVPVAWALATGVALGLLAIGLVLVWPKTFPLWTPLVATFGGIGLTWIVLMWDWKKMLWRFEEMTGADLLDRDSSKGKPEPDEEWVRSEILDKDKGQVKRVEFKFPNDVLSKVAVAVLRDGKNFSRRALSDYMSESQFRYLQQQMLDRGLCRWKDPEHENLGVELAPGGKAFLRGYLPK